MEKLELNVPVIATRGVLIFPGQDVMIEVGRDKSISAVEEAIAYFDGQVFIVSQKDVLVDDPKMNDLFAMGTLCKIKSMKKKEGFLRVTFSGVQRASVIRLSDDERMLFATIKLKKTSSGTAWKKWLWFVKSPKAWNKLPTLVNRSHLKCSVN